MVKNAHVTDLFNRILEEVSDEGFDEKHENGNLCREFGEYLRQMPRNITCGQGSIDGELLVSWEDFGIDVVARSLCIRPEWHVVLYRQSICDVKFSQLVGQGEHLFSNSLNPADAFLGMSKSSCGCPQRIVSQTNVSIIDLEHKQKYFPMVRRWTSTSFYRVPPHSVMPLAWSRVEPGEMFFEPVDEEDGQYYYSQHYIEERSPENIEPFSGSVTASPRLRSMATRSVSLEAKSSRTAAQV